MSIRQIKLINGEELIAELVGEDRDEIVIRNALKVHREKVTIGDVSREANLFTRWMGFCEEDEHYISRHNIIAEGQVNEVVALYYHKMMANNEQDKQEAIVSASEAGEPDVLDKGALYSYEEDEPTFH